MDTRYNCPLYLPKYLPMKNTTRRLVRINERILTIWLHIYQEATSKSDAASLHGRAVLPTVDSTAGYVIHDDGGPRRHDVARNMKAIRRQSIAAHRQSMLKHRRARAQARQLRLHRKPPPPPPQQQ